MISRPTKIRAIRHGLTLLVTLALVPAAAAAPPKDELEASDAESPASSEGESPDAELDADEAVGGDAIDGAPDDAGHDEDAAPQDDDATRAEAADRFFKARLAYEVGRYDEAIADFERAWELSSEPAMLYNLGQAHWKLYSIHDDIEHLRKAQLMFQNYDRQLDGSQGYDPTEVRESLLTIEAQLEHAERQRAATGGKPLGPSAEEMRLQRRLKTTHQLHQTGTALTIVGAVIGAAALGSLIGRVATGFMLDQSGGGKAGTSNQNTASEDRRLRNGYATTGQVAFGTLIGAAVVLPIGISLKVAARVRDKDDGKLQEEVDHKRELRERKVAVRAGTTLFRVDF